MSSASFSSSSASPLKSRHVTAVLGPTNTGKTHLAIERMLSHQTGMIGLPLRLLAREVYDKIAARVGPAQVALITGEEKIKPERPRFYVSTVEAMPRDVEVDFLAVDEIQLAADPERGHVFTDRLFYARGQFETLLLGAGTMRDAIRELLPSANFVARPRLSKLIYAGPKKMSRLPRRSAIVAFSAAEVYEVAELIRRQRGGAAVVLGALSPRTRNAQVALYQSGEVDFLVATDAIGMGLNLDLDHVAFASTRKFDGSAFRTLTAAELGQIAGRAGRHTNDGTFGVTGDAEPFGNEIVDQLEKHEFEPVKILQWRNASLDFGSIGALKESLLELPSHNRLTRGRAADDLVALEHASADAEIAARTTSVQSVRLLWDVCQIPDYRKVSTADHGDLVASIYRYLMQNDGSIPEDWFARQVGESDRSDGDIDTLAQRLAYIRTWTFVSHRAAWIRNAEQWQERTRAIEDSLSDALHERLTQRFVDKRTSVLMKRLRDDEELVAEIGETGTVHVEKHFVGHLTGFRFAPVATDDGVHGKATRHAAAQVLAKELAMRARRVVAAKNDAFKLSRRGAVLWRDEEIGRLERGSEALKPQISVIADEHLAPEDKERVQERLVAWFNDQLEQKLKPLIELVRAEDVSGLARGIAFRLSEGLGVVRRETISAEMKALDQASRAQLRKYGVRFGAFNIYFPMLLKPASTDLLLALSSVAQGEKGADGGGVAPEPPRAGLTSVPADTGIGEAFYRIAGFHVCGARAVRVDILERLADMIRPLVAWRATETSAASPPKGATGDGGFTVIPEMMSILGCSGTELADVLGALGFRVERKPVPVAVAAEPSESAQPAALAIDPLEPAAPEAVTADAEDRSESLDNGAGAPVAAATLEEPAAAPPPADPIPVAAAESEAPAVIEIWRPRRRRSEDFRHSRPPAGDRSGDGRGRPHRHGKHRPAPAAPASTTANEPSQPVAAVTGDGTTLPGQRHGGKPRRRRHHGQGQRAPVEATPSAGPTPASVPTASKPNRGKREESYDPNSPFAKLSKLKEMLEGQRRE